MGPFRRWAVWAIPAGLCAALSSCARSNHPPVYLVRGQVFFRGKPATGALVLLHPVNAADSQAAHPHGQVDQDGVFVLSTYGAKDGAAAGDYVVTIDWRRLLPGRGGQGPSVLPPKYGNPKQSPLRATVQAESNNLPPFQLDR
jgi:hypothetical protein